MIAAIKFANQMHRKALASARAFSVKFALWERVMCSFGARGTNFVSRRRVFLPQSDMRLQYEKTAVQKSPCISRAFLLCREISQRDVVEIVKKTSKNL